MTFDVNKLKLNSSKKRKKLNYECERENQLSFELKRPKSNIKREQPKQARILKTRLLGPKLIENTAQLPWMMERTLPTPLKNSVYKEEKDEHTYTKPTRRNVPNRWIVSS